MKYRCCKNCANCLVLVIGLLAGMQTAYSVDYANIDITDDLVDPVNNPPSVSIAPGQATVASVPDGTEGFFVDAGALTGEFPIRIGADAANDAANGVLLGYVRENDHSVGGEFLYSTAATVRDSDGRSNNTRNLAGALSLAAHRAGEDPGGSLFPPGAPFNVNLAAAYFPFSQGWIGGAAYNAGNGADFNELVASPGLQLGVNLVQDALATGHHTLILPGVVDARRQGVLLVNHATNEGNFGMSEPAADGSSYSVTIHDNAANGAGGELDPMSFLFIPIGTPNVTIARVVSVFGPSANPTPMIHSGSAFTMVREAEGQYRLSIDGESPSTGVLLVSASGPNEDAGGRNADNVVTYLPDGNDWVILSQDLATLDGTGQDTSSSPESLLSFAFLPFDAPPTGPGAIPDIGTLTNFTTSRVIGWNTQITPLSDSNSPGEMYGTITAGTSDLDIRALHSNKGDNAAGIDGAYLSRNEGVLFATIREGLRDNSAVGGFFEYGVANTYLERSEWVVGTIQADPANGEHNINFASVFFGEESGFTLGKQVPTDELEVGFLDVAIDGVNSLTDGVLVVGGYGNDDNFVTSQPRGDGSGWDVRLYDNSTTPEGDPVNYVYLPFDAENLIAGRVGADGTIAASTDEAEFSLIRDDTGEYLLNIVGKTPDDGMLLLTSTGEGDSVDNSVVYETSGDSFRILGLDMISTEDSGLGELVDLEDTSFVFAFIDFDAPPSVGAQFEADFDQDGDVDGDDFLLWRVGFGAMITSGATKMDGDYDNDGDVDGDDFLGWQVEFPSPGDGSASGAVPEPATLALGLLIASLAAVTRRRSTDRRYSD